MIGGHGHVFPRPDGALARCGGPAICNECASDFARQQQMSGKSQPLGSCMSHHNACDCREAHFKSLIDRSDALATAAREVEKWLPKGDPHFGANRHSSHMLDSHNFRKALAEFEKGGG